MKNFDDIFRERLHDFEADPDDALWHKILPLIPKTTPWWGGHKTTLLVTLVVVGLLGIYPRQPHVFDSIQKKDCGLLARKPSQTKNSRYSNRNVARFAEPVDRTLDVPQTEFYNLSKTSVLPANSSAGVGQKTRRNSKNNASQSENTQVLVAIPTDVTLQLSEIHPRVFDSETFLNDLQKAKPEFGLLSNSVFKHNDFRGSLPAVDFETSVDLSPKKIVNKPHWEWFGSVMPLFSYLNVRPTATDQTFVSQVQAPAALSTDRAGVRLQAGVQAWVSKRISVRLSLGFSQQNHRLSYLSTDNSVKSFLVEAVDNQKVKVTPILNKNENNWSSKRNYAGLTASGQYWFVKGKRVSHFVSMGGELFRLLNPEGTNAKISSILKVSYGFTKPISPHFSLNVEPTFSYGTTKQFDTAKLLEVRPYHYGFNVGLLWKP